MQKEYDPNKSTQIGVLFVSQNKSTPQAYSSPQASPQTYSSPQAYSSPQTYGSCYSGSTQTYSSPLISSGYSAPLISSSPAIFSRVRSSFNARNGRFTIRSRETIIPRLPTNYGQTYSIPTTNYSACPT